MRLKELLDRKRKVEHDLSLPTITEVSFEQVNAALNDFSKIITKVEHEKQKDLLHTIINSPDQRSVKDIELFFDASLREEFVLTYDTVHRNICRAKL